MSDPFKITEPTVISFSGGRTSAYMLWRVLRSNNGLPNEAKVVFANTGKEMEATLKFVNECQQRWDVPIAWVEYRTESPKYATVDFSTASRNGEPFAALIKIKNYLPNPVTRFCTQELKVKTIDRYLKGIGFEREKDTDWIGIRADEPRRAAKFPRERTPLVAAGVDAAEVGRFWSSNDFDLELPNYAGKTFHGNCDLCFLKAKNQIQTLIQEDPSRAEWWASMENIVGARFRKDWPFYSEMHNYAISQSDIFDDPISCFCGD